MPDHLSYAGDAAMPIIRRSLTVVVLGAMLAMSHAHLSVNASGEQPTRKQVTISEFLAAARNNNISILSSGLNQRIPVDSKDTKGRTVLLIATYANAIDAARLLIDAGADVNAKDSLNDTPYLYAGAEGRLEILKMTVAAGADLKSVNRYGGTALTPAAHHGHVEVVQYLLTTDIDIDQVNDLGWTALLEAVILGDGGARHIEIVRALVKAGADKTISDRDGVTPLQHAQSHRYKQIVDILN